MEGVEIAYYRLRPMVNEDDVACRVIHRASGLEVRSARDTTRHENRSMAMAMLEVWMGVLDKAKVPGMKANHAETSMIPDGATSVEARGSVKGWDLVFTTPTGDVTVHVGDPERAIKLAMRLTGYIRRLERK